MKLFRVLFNDYIGIYNKFGFRVLLMVRYVVASFDLDLLLFFG